MSTIEGFASAHDAAGSDDVIAVVGMGIAVPGASSPDAFWDLIDAGAPMFGVPANRLDLAHLWSADPRAEDRTYARTSGFMSDFRPHPTLAAELDAGRHRGADFTALWLRHSVFQALDEVTYRPGDRPVFAVGLTPDGSHHLEQSMVVRGVQALCAELEQQVPPALFDRYRLATADPAALLPHRIARVAIADIVDDPEIVVLDTACSSSLYSIDIGVRALRSGDADIALCGGAFALTAQSLVLFAKLRGLSASGRVRPLDARADGALFSDGAAVLALKTRRRAAADGDPILGIVAGFGGSSDGRGKAIYTPNATGQVLAMRRAWSAAGLATGPDWIVAHATGTPVGDRTEMVALTESAPERHWILRSNKSVVGHSGWAAGVVSAVHALLALRHNSIPGQRYFGALPSGAPAGIDDLSPDLDWPAGQNIRHVGVSSMGFGGTNGHLVLTDRPSRGAVHNGYPPAVKDFTAVIVATGTHLPTEPAAGAVSAWLSGDEPRWPATFGDSYPLPSPAEMRLALSTIAAMDRSQLMALRCLTRLGTGWTRHRELRERTGVLIGYSGPTHMAAAYALRNMLADISHSVLAPSGLPTGLLDDRVRASVGPSTEDSYPGLMPNIIAARLAQRLDLHGLNMAVDAGHDSVNSAAAQAVRYLRDGELDAAIVLGVHATSDLLHTLCPSDRGELADAAIGFLLTNAETAARFGLSVLGTVAVGAHGSSDRSIAQHRPPDARDYRGAQGAVAILSALHTVGTGSCATESVRIDAVEDQGTPALVISAPTTVPSSSTLRPNTEPAQSLSPHPANNGELARDFSRYRLALRKAASLTRPPVTDSALSVDCLVIIDNPSILVGMPISPGCLIIAPGAANGAVEGVRYLEDAAQLGAVAGERRFERIRVLVSECEHESVLAMHELAFVAAQVNEFALARGGSVAVLLLGAMAAGVPHPLTGLFGGLARSLHSELPQARMLVLATDERQAAPGLVQLGAELSAEHMLPVAYYHKGQRLEAVLEPASVTMEFAPLPAEPVLVATGGARGVTAHLVLMLARATRPHRVWLLGSGPPPQPDATNPLPSKAELIRTLLAAHPGEKLPQAEARYQRLMHAAAQTHTIAELERYTGLGAVRYLQCDVSDERAVDAAIDMILAECGRIDIVVHGAGLNRSAGLHGKRLTDFRAVRDVKVRGYHHLSQTLAVRNVRPGLWCTVSSVSAIIGMHGEFDYCAANEYLMLAAAYSRAVLGRDEVAFTSGVWTESGMASADTPGGVFIARQAEIGLLSDRQGEQFFAAELHGRPRPGTAAGVLATTWLGRNDWRTLDRFAPGLHEIAEPYGGQTLLTGAPQPDGDDFRWVCDIDPVHHRWLTEHLVEGRPTVPGTFILELGAEAAVALAPELTVVAVTDVRFSRFIRAAAHRWPRRIIVHARRTSNVVDVRVLSPATELTPELEHSRMTVRLAVLRPPAPYLHSEATGGDLAPNSYRLPGTPVRLSGVFDAISDLRLACDGGSAALNFPLRHGHSALDRFVLPSVTLDCLLRTTVLHGPTATVAAMVPTELGVVHLFSDGNDATLARRWPEGLTLRHWRDHHDVRRCAALAPGGRVVLLVEGITGSELAHYDIHTERWRYPVVTS